MWTKANMETATQMKTAQALCGLYLVAADADK